MNLEERVAYLEYKLDRLEKKMDHVINNTSAFRILGENEFVEKYGEIVNKTEAAVILKVTRGTVYAMLADGRIDPACERMVSVRSIYRYIHRRK